MPFDRRDLLPSAVTSHAAEAPAGARPVRLVLTRARRSVRISPGQTILEAVEAGGAGIPFACRIGVCGTCRTRVLSGEVDSDAPALTPVDRAAGYTYPCSAWARTDCTIDA